MRKNLLLAIMAILIASDYSMAASKSASATQGSTIYLIRDRAKLSGGLQEAWFYIEGHKVASLNSNQYAVLKVALGKHKIGIRGDDNYKPNEATITIGKNQSLYLKADPVAGRAITFLVAPLVEEGTVKAFGISKMSAQEFAKLKPKLSKANVITYDKSPVKIASNMAQVYIYRAEAGVSNGVQAAQIYVGNKKVARLVDHQYIVIPLPEGSHTVAVSGIENSRKEKLKLKVKPGEQYYLTPSVRGAHAVTYAATPLLNLAVKPFELKQTEKKDFDAVKGKLGRLKLMQ